MTPFNQVLCVLANLYQVSLGLTLLQHTVYKNLVVCGNLRSLSFAPKPVMVPWCMFLTSRMTFVMVYPDNAHSKSVLRSE